MKHNGIGVTNKMDYGRKGMPKAKGEEKTSNGFKPAPRSGEYAQVSSNKDYGVPKHTAWTGHRYTNKVAGGFKASPRSGEVAQVSNKMDYNKGNLNYNDFGSEKQGPSIMAPKPKAL